MTQMDGTPIPEHPTIRDVCQMLERLYTPKGVLMALKSPNTLLDGRAPIDLLDTPEGRREAYGWAMSVAEGTFL